MNVEGNHLQDWLARVDKAEGYSAHALLHELTSAAMLDDWSDDEKEGNGFYLLLGPFLNKCDLGLGRIASKLCKFPRFSFREEEITEDCNIFVTMLNRFALVFSGITVSVTK